MLNDVKVGDKVWTMQLNTPKQRVVKLIYPYRGRTFLYFNTTTSDNQSSEFCFPTLDALLDHLRTTAIHLT